MSALIRARRRRAAITMVPSSSFIQEGQSVKLSGEVRINGRLAPGIVIVFAADCSIGAVIPSMVVTNARGKYSVEYRSFVPPTPIGPRVASVTAALPSFLGVTAVVNIAILPSSGRTRRRWRKSRTGCTACQRKMYRATNGKRSRKYR